MKLAFVFDHFGPYHFARVREAAKLPGWKVTGVELHPRSRTYGWEPGEGRTGAFRKISLPRVELRERAERRALRPHLERVLGECGPDVVFVNGWGDFMSLETIRWAKKQGVRLVVMSETRRVDGKRSWWGEWVKKKIVKLCDAGLCGGESHRNYLEDLGLPKETVSLGYNAVDNEFFGVKRNKKDFSDFRFQFSAGDNEIAHCPSPYFLASNRFVARKNIARLIEAYGRYAGNFQGAGFMDQHSINEVWPLVLLGDGELRGELESLCLNLGLDVVSGELPADSKLNSYKLKNPTKQGGVVYFAGFRQIDELPLFYAGAGAFIHPALSEPWGLVINEAMASGLPILSSKNVGASEELVLNGTNGFTFAPENVEEFASLLLRMAEMRPDERMAMGEASRCIIANWGPDRFAKGAEEAALAAMSAPQKGLSVFDRILLEILICK